jgi:hypothetical protein
MERNKVLICSDQAMDMQLLNERDFCLQDVTLKLSYSPVHFFGRELKFSGLDRGYGERLIPLEAPP